MQKLIIGSDKEAERNDEVRFMQLWDLYGGLLTKTQREIADLYFGFDLSLGEIAEQKGVSRQSVSDCLRQCRKKVEDAERKLGFAKTLDSISGSYKEKSAKIGRWIEKQQAVYPNQDALKELKEIVAESLLDDKE